MIINMKKVKVLIVGAAFCADLHMEAYQRCRDIAEVIGFCDLVPEKVENLAKRYGVGDYLAYNDYKTAIDESGCDVVDICLPNFLHFPVAIYAFSGGKHVICEKPLALTSKDGLEMVAAAEKAGKKLYYAEDWLFAPAIIRALEIVDEGAIGDVQFIRAREAHGGSHSPYAQTIAYCGGGCMIHLGVHPIGLVLAMKQNLWTSLSATTTGGGENNLRHKKMEGEDWGSCNIVFDDGTVALVEANYLTAGGMEDVISFYGTKGCLHIDIGFSSAIRCFSINGMAYTVEKAEVTTGWSNPSVDEKFNLGYIDEIRHFMECIRTDTEPRVGLRGVDGYEALKVVEAIYASAKQGVTVKNPASGQAAK